MKFTTRWHSRLLMVELPLHLWHILLPLPLLSRNLKLPRVAEPSPFGLVCSAGPRSLESGQVGLTSEGACLTSEWSRKWRMGAHHCQWPGLGMFTLPETRDARSESPGVRKMWVLIWKVSRPFRTAAFSPAGLNNANDIRGPWRRVKWEKIMVALFAGGENWLEYTRSGCLARHTEGAQK